MRNDAREVMQNRLSEKQDVPQVFYGFIGNPDGVVNVPGRQNYVYVTLADGLVTQAYNVICPMIYNLPVICGYDQNQKSSGLLKVLGVRNLPRAKPQTTSTVEHHHASHEWMNPNGNTDVVYTELRQFMPLRPTPVAPYSIRINRGVLKIGADWKVVGGVTIDLTSYIPFTSTTSGSGYLMAKYVLVSISGASGSPVVTDGSTLSAYSIGLPNIPATPAGHYPICAVQLYAGQTKIDETYSKTDIIDLRWGMFANSQIIPQTKTAVPYQYLTSYDASTGAFTSGSALQWGYIQRYGFVDNTATSGSFNQGNFTFTLSASGSAPWLYFRNGYVCSVSGSKSVALTSGSSLAKGTYYVYIDSGDGTLVSSTSPWTLLDTKVPVAIIIWDNTLTPKFWYMDERHTCLIDRRMHYYEHVTEGTRYISGGIPSGYTVTGSVNTDNTFAVSATNIADEDLNHSLPALADGSGSTVNYVSFYRNNSLTSWNWELSIMPYRYTNAGYIQYDSSGSMVEGVNNRFYNSYLLYTNLSGSACYTMVNGRGQYSTLADAQAENPGTWDWTGVPIAEFVIAYQFTWDTSSSYTTNGKARLAATPKRLNISLTQTAVGSPSIDHNTLAGLQGGVAGQYYHLTAAQQAIAIQAAGSGASGYLTQTDWNRFNSTSGSAGISDAPTDGKLYGRKNATWIEIVSGSGTSGSQVVPLNHPAVAGEYLTGYSNVTGSFTSGSVASSSGSGLPLNGWADIGATLTYLTADAPTYYLTTSADLTGSLSVGMKLKFTQAGSSVYGFITAISSGSMAVYCGTDYSVSGSAITSPAYSGQKAPYGFPLNPDKWTVTYISGSAGTQATPVQNTWYNLGSASINIPIGVFVVSYQVGLIFSDATSAAWILQSTLSTANNSESDPQFTTRILGGSLTVMESVVYREKTLSITTKTTYYLNTRTTSSGLDNMYNGGDNSPTMIRAVCAYL